MTFRDMKKLKLVTYFSWCLEDLMMPLSRNEWTKASSKGVQIVYFYIKKAKLDKDFRMDWICLHMMYLLFTCKHKFSITCSNTVRQKTWLRSWLAFSQSFRLSRWHNCIWINTYRGADRLSALQSSFWHLCLSPEKKHEQLKI